MSAGEHINRAIKADRLAEAIAGVIDAAAGPEADRLRAEPERAEAASWFAKWMGPEDWAALASSVDVRAPSADTQAMVVALLEARAARQLEAEDAGEVLCTMTTPYASTLHASHRRCWGEWATDFATYVLARRARGLTHHEVEYGPPAITVDAESWSAKWLRTGQ